MSTKTKREPKLEKLRTSAAAADRAKTEADDELSARQAERDAARLRRDEALAGLRKAERALDAAEKRYDKAKQASRAAAESVKDAQAQQQVLPASAWVSATLRLPYGLPIDTNRLGRQSSLTRWTGVWIRGCHRRGRGDHRTDDRRAAGPRRQGRTGVGRTTVGACATGNTTANQPAARQQPFQDPFQARRGHRPRLRGGQSRRPGLGAQPLRVARCGGAA